MGQPLIAVDPEKLDAIMHQLDRLHRRLDAVDMAKQPDWLPIAAYAKHVDRTERTVRNWISDGRVDTKREGEALFVRISRGV